MNTENNQRAGPSVAEVEDAAVWLVTIAGEMSRHIIMPTIGPNKYVWRNGALTADQVRRHLQGTGPVVGAELRRQDGYTQALAFDVDTGTGWRILNVAARALAASGARPLLVRSPAGRGGHLWLCFDRPVDPDTAFQTVYQYAPLLAAVREYWPRPSQLAVRLPGGFYRSTARGQPVAAWCAVALIVADVPAEYSAGPAIARLLLQAQTPSWWVQPGAHAGSRPIASTLSTPTAPPRRLFNPPSDRETKHVLAETRPLPSAAHDPLWQAQHAHDYQTLWFWITDHEAAAWFNSRTTARDLLPPAANGYGLAHWRNERTASVGYRADGGWVDHGAGGCRPDDQRDGGDALDLYCRLEHLNRSQALRRIVRDMIPHARDELEAAAREQRSPAQWVCQICSPAGWAHYDAVRRAVVAQEPSTTLKESIEP